MSLALAFLIHNKPLYLSFHLVRSLSLDLAYRFIINNTSVSLLVFHHTDNHILVFFIALDLSIYNKQRFIDVNKTNYRTPALPLSPEHDLPPFHLVPPSVCEDSISSRFIFRCSSSPNNPVYVRRVDSSDLVFSLSSHRHS